MTPTHSIAFSPRLSPRRVRWFPILATVFAFAGTAGPAHAQVAGSIVVYPTSSSLEVSGTRQFTAYVPISPNTIIWLVNGVQGGDATLGTISATGLYKPPAVIPANNVLTITAKSTAFPSSAGSATLTVTRPNPSLWSVSPSSFPIGPYSVSLGGANFAPDSQALVNGAPVQTTFVSATKIIATGTAASLGTMQFAVRQPGPGSVTGNTVTATVFAANIAVTVAPASASALLGASQAFAAAVTGTTNGAVTWSVNGTVGGSAAVGTISTAGLYTAPAAMPASQIVTIRAASVVNPAASGQATLTLVSPVKVTMSPTAATMQVGTTQAFVATVTGSPNTAVNWFVNATAGGSAALGTITASGFYTAPIAMPVANTVTVRAVAAASSTSSAQATVTLTTPPPPAVSMTAARFLEQSSFGPTPATLAHVQQIGIGPYLDEQFGLPETAIYTSSTNSMTELRQWLLANYTTAPDQLRQRVAYALGQIIVTSANKLVYANEIQPWLRLLSQHAFGNYRDLLHDMSMSPSMGKYLDLANSVKPSGASGANENYPRELMQLFSIGLWKLNQDGSLVIGADGMPVSTYDQNTVRQVALALTGWTYATAPGATPKATNWEYFGAPMETRQGNHATSAKSFLGCSVPANQSVQQDLDSVIDCLMQHPNMPPFIATRLIRSLVTSNPSPAYITRVANVFAGANGGTRGDLKATVTAILLDPEARADTATATQGRLKEPILHISGLLRALNGRFSSTNGLVYLYDYMAQAVLAPPSVFSWFSPLYHVPNNALFGPEFQIYSPTEATLRGNFFYMVLTSPPGDTIVDLTPFLPYGNDVPNLVEAANQILLYGRMPTGMRQALITAASPGYDANTRMLTVLYLTALSGQYAVQY